MSDYQHHKGTLIPIKENISPEAFAEKIYDVIPDYYENKLEMLKDNEAYYISGDLVYVVHDSIHDETDWFLAKMDENGIIEYDVNYYDGGCGFSEALDTAVMSCSQGKK
jgi:hypothetical protein